MSIEMKESGIEWIGKIPKEWNVSKVKNVFTLYTGNSIPDSEKDKYVDSENAVPYIATKEIDADSSRVDYANGMYVKKNNPSFKVAPKESILLCIEGGSAGKKIAFLDQDVCFVNKLCCLNPKSINNKFGYYYLKSPAFTKEFNLHISGLIGGVSQRELKNFSICLPSFQEQKKISNFLDGKVSEIDKVIAKTKESIEEYEVLKRTTIVNVIKGSFSKCSNYIDSGIEWIGFVPIDWTINMMFQLFDIVKNKNRELLEHNLLSLSYGRIIEKNIDTTYGLLPESFETYNIIESNDIVLRLTDLQNDHKSLRVGISTEKGIITSAYVTLHNVSDNNPKYLYYFLHSYDLVKGFYGMGAGVRQGLNWEKLKNMKLALPPVYDQNEIVEYLDSKCLEFNELICYKENLINELEQYKKSLIYEYVTGKKEVK